MKTISILILTALALGSYAGEVDSKSLKSAVMEFAKQAHGHYSEKVMPGSPHEMLVRFIEVSGGEVSDYEESEDYMKFTAYTGGTDEGGYGLVNLKGALGFAGVELYRDDGQELSPAEYKIATDKLKKLILQMKDAGAYFGYTGFGSSACGVHFPALLVFDTETGTIYVLHSLPGGPC